jgi:predicted regulator of Ras-like GTPase activity (Roadblock/LC7/MglB family)
MHAEEIQQSLEKLKNSSQVIEATALVSNEGFIMASVLPEALGEERIAGLSAAFMGLAERCAAEMGKGGPKQLFIQAELGYIVMMGVGNGTYLSVLATSQGKPGMLLFDMKKAAEEIKRLL